MMLAYTCTVDTICIKGIPSNAFTCTRLFVFFFPQIMAVLTYLKACMVENWGFFVLFFVFLRLTLT